MTKPVNRREFIKLAGLLSVSGLLPELAFASSAADNPNRHQRIVVLVELKGGNDGFNTLIPHDDELYFKLRPNLAVLKRQVLKLNDHVGLNPQMKALMPLWNSGKMAWIEGVGYPYPVLSHFRSMDIWDSASNANQFIEAGWLSRVLPRFKKGLHGIALNEGQAELGPLSASNLTSVTMQDPKTFLSQIRLIDDVSPSNLNPAIAHVSNTQHQLYAVGEQIARKMGNQRVHTGVQFSKGVLGNSLEAVAEMILSGVDAPVYKVTQGGFDTHSSQRQTQDNALYHVANGLASFATTMQKAGLWDNILLMTYSEFGRRIKENRGAGTDHGTASAHLVLGGRVHGGIYGSHPDLSRLDANGNVRHTTDFRSLYATLAQRWWNQPNPWNGHNPIQFV